MADIQFMRIQFLQDNPYGTFVAGDVLDVYINPDDVVTNLGITTEGVTVNLNGSPLLSSSAFFPSDNSIISVQYFGVEFCVTTYLILPYIKQQAHPYGQYFPQANHNSCAVDPSVCDLIIIGVPDVVSATDQDQSDGSITINAISSNPIQYKIGSDFIYNDGSGQTSNTFNGLLPGEYRIYLRDEFNCATNVLVTVPFNLVYGERFRFEYTDDLGNDTKISITKRSYTGEVSEVIGNGVAFDISLRGEGGRNKFEPIQSIEGICNLLDLEDGQFSELYTNDPSLYRMEYHKNFGSGYELLWRGKVLPQLYGEEFIHVPFNVSVTASDALIELDSLYLIQKDGKKYVGNVKLINLVSHCLKLLRLDLNIRVATNIFADNMDDSNSPFYQAYVNYEAFYIAKDVPDLNFVMKSILEPFGARLIQWGSYWWITRVEELVTDYNYHEFDTDGVLIGSGVYSGIKELDFPSNDNDTHFVNKEQRIDMRPGYGLLTAKYSLGVKDNILENGDFVLTKEYNSFIDSYVFVPDTRGFTLVGDGNTIQLSYEILDFTDFNNKIALRIIQSTDDYTKYGKAYIQSESYFLKMATDGSLKITVVFKLNVPPIDLPHIKVRMRIKYGLLYLYSDGTWQTTENNLVYNITTYNTYTSIAITAPCPQVFSPQLGMDFDVRVYIPHSLYADYYSISDLENVPTASKPTGFRTEINDNDEALYYYELTEGASGASGFNVIEPDDYDGTLNPRRWVQVGKLYSPFQTLPESSFPVGEINIDRIQVKYLINGQDPFDFLVRRVNAEPTNKLELEKELIIGSFSQLNDFTFSFAQGFAATGAIITQNVMPSDLIYAGYLRDVDGNGYENWTRVGIAESDRLHGIMLKSYAAQYKRSWRQLTCAMRDNNYFNFIDIVRVLSNGNRLYLPMGITLNDRSRIYRGEFHELMDIYSNPGSDGSGEAPYSSGFTTGFGSSGFN